MRLLAVAERLSCPSTPSTLPFSQLIGLLHEAGEILVTLENTPERVLLEKARVNLLSLYWRIHRGDTQQAMDLLIEFDDLVFADPILLCAKGFLCSEMGDEFSASCCHATALMLSASPTAHMITTYDKAGFYNGNISK